MHKATAAPSVLPVVLALAACADPNTRHANQPPNRTTAQQTRDTLDPPRGPAGAAGRAADSATNRDRP